MKRGSDEVTASVVLRTVIYASRTYVCVCVCVFSRPWLMCADIYAEVLH